MKKYVLFLVLSSSLIAGNAYSADHRSGDRAKHSDRKYSERSRHHRSERSRHHSQSRSGRGYQRHSYSSRRYSNQSSHHRRSRDNRNAGYFLGGLVLGSLSQGYANSHRSRHHDHSPHNCSHESHHRDYSDYPISYWRDRHGSCYRVEYRRSGKVYVGVQDYKCH